MDEKNSYMVEVPAPIYPEVLAFMAKLMSAHKPDAAPGEVVDVPGNGSWSEADIVNLHTRMKNPLGRAVITRIAVASLADEDVTYEQIREAGDAVDGQGVFSPV